MPQPKLRLASRKRDIDILVHQLDYAERCADKIKLVMRGKLSYEHIRLNAETLNVNIVTLAS
jgi:hypothetical protein